MSEETTIVDGDLVQKVIVNYCDTNGSIELRLEINKGEIVHHQKRRGETLVIYYSHEFSVDIPIDLAIMQYEQQTKGDS